MAFTTFLDISKTIRKKNTPGINMFKSVKIILNPNFLSLPKNWKSIKAEWIKICPKCGIDSVIGSASGYPIEHSFLMKMREFWFSPSEWSKTMGG